MTYIVFSVVATWTFLIMTFIVAWTFTVILFYHPNDAIYNLVIWIQHPTVFSCYLNHFNLSFLNYL